MTNELAELIATSLAFVNQHPAHDLNLGYRQAIWKTLNKTDTGESTSIGHQRRTILAIDTVRFVLPIWQDVFPNDDMPEQILKEAMLVMQGKIEEEDALKNLNDYYEYVHTLMLRSKSMATAVAYAAIKALEVAISDEIFDEDEIDYNITDKEDFECNDTTFFAAVAYANGPVWEIMAALIPDSLKRKEVWEWWLTSAVPKVYKTASYI